MNMHKHQFYICGLVCFAAVALSQTLPPTFPTSKNSGYVAVQSRTQAVTRKSQISGREYISILEQPGVSPEWESSAPLPITLAAAEKLARVELAKVVPDEPDWIASDFQISRFGADPNWYYAVNLQPILRLSGQTSEALTVLVDFSGHPGRVWQLGPQQVQR